MWDVKAFEARMVHWLVLGFYLNYVGCKVLF